MSEYSKLNRSGLVARCINLKQQAQSARERTFTVRRQFDALEKCGTDAEKDMVTMGKSLTVIEQIVRDHAGEFGRWGEAIRFQVIRGFGGRELRQHEWEAMSG